MVESAPGRFGDWRRIAPRPDGLRPALQQEDFIVLRDRPFDILWLAVVAFDVLADREKGRDLRIRILIQQLPKYGPKRSGSD